jgi:type IV secretory pathway VirB2 component (pilin)
VEKKGFYRWAWLVIIIMGGIGMVFGGAQDVILFFSDDLIIIHSWHPVIPVVGLVCGIIVMITGGLNIMWGWQIKQAEGTIEKKLAQKVALFSVVAMIFDWICGYYGFGSLMALLTAIYLLRR